MADKKISELPASSALDTDDLIAVVEDGTTVKATIQDLLDLSPAGSGLPEGYSIPAFTPAVLTDQTTTMTAAINELPAATGGVVMIPEGTFYTRILISGQAGLTFRGAGKLATTIVGPTTDPIVNTASTPRGGYLFEDLTFDLGDAFVTMAIYSDDLDVTFRRCRFINITGRGISCVGSVGSTFEDCDFDDGGLTVGQAVVCSGGTRRLHWVRSTARFMSGGLEFDGPCDDIDVDGGLFDGGWYLLRTRSGGYTNSGGTVTYSSTVLTDTAASFGDVSLATNPAGINVRVLPVLESGSTGTSYFSNYVDDSAATFVTNVVQPGYIIRTATKWAIVSRVFSETKLYVEEWFDSTTYRPTQGPATDTAYTVHRVLIGLVNTNTGTTITVERWFDFHDGASVTPAAGSLYEVLIDHGEYSGIHASAATPHATGGIRRIRVHGGTRITRVWNDQLSIYGSDARLVVEPSVIIDHGQDFGITSHSDQARIAGTVVHNGAVNIACTGEDSQINAYVSGGANTNIVNTVWLGDIVISGSRTRVSGTVAVASGANHRHGIVVFGSTADGVVDSVDLTGASVDGYSVAEYKLYGADPATVTNTNLLDTTGTIVEVNATGTVGPAHPSGTTSAAGILELATTGETQTGTDTARAVTPAGLASTQLLRPQLTAPTGALSETVDRRNNHISQTIVGGTLYMTAIWLPAGVTVTSISFVNGNTSLASGTHQWFGLFDSSRVALRFTSDDTSTAWGSFATKTLNLSTTFVTTYSGLHYIGLVVTVSGTLPKPYGLATGSSTVSMLAPAINGTADTGLTSPPSIPFTAAAFTAGTGLIHFYAYVS